jgi:hypothetical protein
MMTRLSSLEFDANNDEVQRFNYLQKLGVANKIDDDLTAAILAGSEGNDYVSMWHATRRGTF